MYPLANFNTLLTLSIYLIGYQLVIVNLAGWTVTGNISVVWISNLVKPVEKFYQVHFIIIFNILGESQTGGLPAKATGSVHSRYTQISIRHAILSEVGTPFKGLHVAYFHIAVAVALVQVQC